MLRVGSTVKIQGSNSKGVVLGIDQDTAKLNINNHVSSYPLTQLEEEDNLLLDRFIKKDFDEGLRFILSVDAYRLLTEYKFNPYVLASSTKINIFPHQIDEVIKILENPRMMIADEVGLGKTIIAALVATELKERGLANKILYVVPKSLVLKWQSELSNRFETPSEIVDSDYLRKHDGDVFKGEAFCYITSIDFLKQKHIMKILTDSNLDLVVVDEAHKLSYGTDRYSLGKLLAERTNFLFFLTATPHNGNDEDFLQRMRLLDRYFYHISTTSHLMTRNIKEDVIDLDGKEVFPPRETKQIDVRLTDSEIRLHNKVDDYISERLQEANTFDERNAMRFLTIIIRKRASSSIRALKNTLQKRMEKLGTSKMPETRREEEGGDDSDEEADEKNYEKIIGFTLANIPKEKQEILNLLSDIESIEKIDSKLQLLLEFIENTKKTDPYAKMVVFTEYRDTLNYLRDRLSARYRVGSIDGSMNIQERNEALNKFKPNRLNPTESYEVMVCTDAAGEGIDMQFCNIEINYDLPWNPTRLEQRMGRIHRIGQDRKVFYYNFILSDTIDGQILARLHTKMEAIKNAIGDKVYDVIGKLVSEQDLAILYEELINLPKEKWEAKLKKIDGIIEEKKRLLDEINKLLSGYRLDKSKLEQIKNNVQNVLGKEEIKRFIQYYQDYYKAKFDPINEEEEVYRIFLPKHIAIPFGGSRIVEGSFDRDVALRKDYRYLGLGNPYLMSLIHDAAKPSVSVLEHTEESGTLLVYKIAVKDGKGKERNGKIVAFLVDNKKETVKEMSIQDDIWKFQSSNSPSSISYDTKLIQNSKDIADVYADKLADNLIKETSPRLFEVAGSTKDSIMRHFSKEIGEIATKINGYEQRLDESPSYSRLIDRERNKIKQLKDELNKKIEEINRDFDAHPAVELIGGSLIVHPTTTNQIKAKLERPGFVPRLSDFSKLNQQYNTENSDTTHQRLLHNSQEWIEYHTLYREARKGWKVIPYERLIHRIIEISPRLKVGDFGCGEAKILEALGEARVFSCDHIAINDKVTACDMKSVPLPDGSLDVVVFSLSLMGKNWPDYIVEARRCLWKDGDLLIAETTNALTEGRLSDLRNVLQNHGFRIVKEEPIDIFTFIEAKKIS